MILAVFIAGKKDNEAAFHSAVESLGVELANMEKIEGEYFMFAFDYENKKCYYATAGVSIQFGFENIISAKTLDSKTSSTIIKGKIDDYAFWGKIGVNAGQETIVWVNSVYVHFVLNTPELQSVDVNCFSGKKESTSSEVIRAYKNAKKIMDQCERIFAMIPASSNPSTPSSTDELAQAAQMFKDGLLTEEEFNTLKGRILNQK